MYMNDKEVEILTSPKTFYKGVIEDNNDPLKIGRVRVRVLGVHSSSIEDVPVDTLPWCLTLKSLDFGGFQSGVGISSIPTQGTWVWCIAENNDTTRFVVLGAIPGISKTKPSGHGFVDPDGVYPKILNQSDHNSLQTADYLNNHTIQTPGGHLVELNDDGHIKITHINHNFIQITKDGDINVYSKKDTNINVDGNTTITTKGNTNVNTTGNNTIQAGGANNIVSAGDCTISCVNLTANASGNANIVAGGTGKFQSSGLLTLQGSAVKIQGASVLMV